MEQPGRRRVRAFSLREKVSPQVTDEGYTVSPFQAKKDHPRKTGDGLMISNQIWEAVPKAERMHFCTLPGLSQSPMTTL
jgi:hypothetical protein